MNIYEYNNPCIYNGKAILFLGNAQIPFIQTFINFYLNVTYDDNFRFSFKIDDNNSQNYSIFNIKPNKLFEKKFNYNIEILSIPFSETNQEKFKKI